MNITSRIKRDWWLYLLTASIPGILLVGWYISIQYGYNYQLIVQNIGLVGPIFVSLALAFLYRELTIVQGEQTNIMRSQKKMMEVEHEPILEIDRVAYDEDNPKNYITIFVSNSGKGTAENITAKIRGEPIPDTDMELEFKERTAEIVRDNDQKLNDNLHSIDESGNYIRPGESQVPMKCSGLIKYKPEDRPPIQTHEIGRAHV